jgi:hypothetical protein
MSNTTKTRLYYAPLPYKIAEDEVATFIINLFADYTNLEVDDVRVCKDRETGFVKPFCFVDVDSEIADTLVEKFNGEMTESGKSITLNVARPKEDRPARSGGYSNGGSSRYGNNSGGYQKSGGYNKSY